MRRAALLVVPGMFLPLAALVALAPALPGSAAVALRAAPLAVFGGGALLGLLIGRARLVLAVVVLALADYALVHVGGRAVFNAVAVLLPVNLVVIAWLGEESLISARGASRLGVILLQAAVIAILLQTAQAAVAAWLERPLVTANLVAWTALPQPALVAFAAALGLMLILLLVDKRPFTSGAGWTLVASLLALDGASAGRPARVHLVTAGLMLLTGAAWERPRVAYPDDVTGLPGRLALNEALRRLRRRYALARTEIDDYVRFREEHGADAAQRMLRLVAEALTKVGGRGRVFCVGTNAFAVVFRGRSAAEAARHLDAVRRAVEAATLDVRVSKRPPADRHARPAVAERTLSVTISVGVAQSTDRGADSHQVLQAAERALDRAKLAGLNRVSA
ncbi:MAG TPA: diguanylate cyclase [Methylomirabilota bacterium]|nr:diguanylate cyclase [Methylomirabilota bacterium]